MAAQIIKISAWGILIFIACSACAQSKTKKATAVQSFKNYALSACLANGFQSKEVVNDAAAAARGYLELGDLPLEAHTQALRLSKKFLLKEYKSISGEKLVLMKCIDFYSSRDLDLIAGEYAIKK
jgi:hypothetical protein